MKFRAEKGESSEVFCYERFGSCLSHVFFWFGFQSSCVTFRCCVRGREEVFVGDVRSKVMA